MPEQNAKINTVFLPQIFSIDISINLEQSGTKYSILFQGKQTNRFQDKWVHSIDTPIFGLIFSGFEST